MGWTEVNALSLYACRHHTLNQPGMGPGVQARIHASDQGSLGKTTERVTRGVSQAL